MFRNKNSITSSIYLGYHDEATFTLSNQGTYKLVCNDNEFTRHRLCSDGSTYWVCSRRKRNCKAKAHTKQFGSVEMVKYIGEHCHADTNKKSKKLNKA